jgi:hypothetical protein
VKLSTLLITLLSGCSTISIIQPIPICGKDLTKQELSSCQVEASPTPGSTFTQGLELGVKARKSLQDCESKRKLLADTILTCRKSAEEFNSKAIK